MKSNNGTTSAIEAAATDGFSPKHHTKPANAALENSKTKIPSMETRDMS
jgi:hypothetical protein